VWAGNHYVQSATSSSCRTTDNTSSHNLSISGNVWSDNWHWSGTTPTELDPNT
jgi:hypothetical protein